MRKTFLTFCTVALSLLAVSSCYNDAAVWEEFDAVHGELDGLTARIEALEKKLNSEVATLNSKIGALEAADADLLAKIKSLSTELDALDGVVDGYIESNDADLAAAIEELKKADEALAAVDTDVLAALAALNVVSVEKNEAGNVVITFFDKSTVEVGAADANANNTGLVTVVDGKWAVVGPDGKTTVLDAAVHPDTVLEFKVVDNELYVSYDGETWEKTGVVVNDETTINVVTDVVYTEGDEFVTIVVGENEYVLPFYQADNSSLVLGRTDVFFNYGATKTIELEAEGVEEYYVMSKPDGWKAELEGTTLTVSAPAKALIEMGAADLKGKVLVHATVVNGACKVAKLDVTTGEALLLSYADGNVSLFSALTQEQASYWPGEPPTVTFTSIQYGILTIDEFVQYGSFAEYMMTEPAPSGGMNSVLGNILQSDMPEYVEGETEELNVSVPLSEIVNGTWGGESYLEFDEDEVYVLWIAPEYGYDGCSYDEAQFVVSGEYVSFEDVESVYNNVAFEAKMYGADGFIIGATDKAQFDEWINQDPELTYEAALQEYLTGTWTPGPLANFNNGDKTAMGEMYPSGVQDVSLSDVLLQSNMGGGVMPGGNETTVNSDAEYYVWVLPYSESKDLAEYGYSDLIITTAKTAALTEGVAAKSAVEVSPAYNSVTYTIEPKDGGKYFFALVTKEYYEETYVVEGEFAADVFYKEYKNGYPYDFPLEDEVMNYETATYEDMVPGSDYVFIVYSMVEGNYYAEVVPFTTFDSASAYLASLNDGDTWVLAGDLELSSTLTIDKKLTIDLRSNTISSTATVFYITPDGDLTISNGTVETSGNVFYNNGTLTINNGTYTTTGDQAACVYCDGPVVNGYSTDAPWNLTINGGTFVSEKQTALSLQNNYYNLSPAGSAVVKAGTFTGAPTGAAYDMYVGCAKVTVDAFACEFTNDRIYAKAEPSLSPACPAWINGVEYLTDGLIELVPTPDGKQWVFKSPEFDDVFGGGKNPDYLFDLGVSMKEQYAASHGFTASLAVDYEDIYGEDAAGVWVAPLYAAHTVTPSSVTAGKVEFSGMQIPYSGLDGTKCKFDFSEFFMEDPGTVVVDATLVDTPVFVTPQ